MNAQGHIEPYKRNGVAALDRWRIVIDRGRDEAGRRHRDYYPATGSRKAAEKELRRLLSTADADRYAAPERMTCAEWFETWVRDYAPINIHAATLEGYAGVVSRYLIPELGTIRLQKLGAETIQAMYRRMEAPVDEGGRGLSWKTVRHAHIVLHRALDQAWQNGRVPFNAAERGRGVKPPTGKGKPKRKTLALEVGESLELLSYAEGTRMHLPVMLATATGMRAGEVLALTWDNVDLVNGEVRVVQAWEEADGVLALKEPKSEKGRRTIPLPPAAVDELARLKDEHEARRRGVEKMAGRGAYCMEYGPLVVCDAIGRPWRPGSFASRYIEFRADALERWTAAHADDETPQEPPKWARARYHDLRRSAGSQWLVAGIAPKVVSEWLGHFSVSFTMDVYCDILESLEQESRRIVADMWAQTGATNRGLGDKSGANRLEPAQAVNE